jgi:hypothetical protein
MIQGALYFSTLSQVGDKPKLVELNSVFDLIFVAS